MNTEVRSRLTSLAIVILMLVLLATTACGPTGATDEASGNGSGSPAEEPAETPTDSEPETDVAPPAAEKTTVQAFFVRGESLGVAVREIPATQTTAKAALEALMAGPTAEEKEFGLGTAIPTGTKLLGVNVENGVATVDMTSEYGSGGGSLSMLLRVAQVVYTATQFDEIKAVNVALDGERVDYIGGEGVEVTEERRADFEGQLPAILIESPAPGQPAASPLKITGLANTFEGSFFVNVTDPEGLIIAEEIVNYTGGTGTYGEFSVSVPFENTREGLGAVIAFEKSPKDGAQTNVVEIPVRMKP